MGVKVAIATVDQTATLHETSGVDVDLQYNERGTARFTTKPGYIPALRSEVVIYDQDETTPIFGGVVYQRDASGEGPHTFAVCECADWTWYLDHITVAGGTLAAGVALTLLEVCQWFQTNYLSAYGFTLDPAQVTGPTVGTKGLEWERQTASDALRMIGTLYDGYVFGVSPTKVWGMYLPNLGTPTAPFTITDSNSTARELKWSETSEGYATRIILRWGGSGTREQTQSWTVDAGVIADGYVETAVPSTPTGGVSATIDTGSGPVAATVGVSGTQLIWDWALHRLTAGSYVPSLGDVIALTYTAQYPAETIADSGVNPPIERVETKDDITDPDTAEALAEGMRLAAYQSPRTFEIDSVVDGLRPGQIISINSTHRSSASLTAMITRVAIQMVTDDIWTYRATATTGIYAGSDLDFWRSLGGGGGGGGALTVTYTGGTNPAVGYPLTKTDDSNVTLTLGGGHAASVLAATSLTLGWTGTLSLARGGTAAALTAAHGAIAYSTASAIGFSGVGSSGQILRSGGAGAPTWSTATYPSATSVAGTFPRSDGTNFVNSSLVLPDGISVGRLMVATSENGLGGLAPGSSGQILRSAGAGVVPAWSTATYPGTATTTGAYLRADGTNWIMSTLVLPNAATATRMVYATATNTYGESANLTFDGTHLAVAGTLDLTSVTGSGLVAGSIFKGATTGVTLYGVTGSTYDVGIRNASFDLVQGVLAGTTTTAFLGAVNLDSYIGHPSYVSQTTRWRITALGEADFRYLFVDEMHAKVFIADLEQALAGGQIITKSVAMVAQAFTVPAAGAAATLWVRDLPSAAHMLVFEANDFVVLRTFSRAAGSLTIADAVGVVTAGATDPGGTDTQSWTFTRASGANAGTMSGGTIIAVDSLVLDYGVSGNGYYEVSAVDGLYGINSPYAQIVTWTTAPVAANKTLRTRFGNLRGVTAVDGEYGFIAGTYAASNGQYLRASNSAFELHGINLLMWDGATNVIKLDRTAPSFALGSPVPSAFGTGAGIWMGKDAGAYKFRVGDPSGGKLSWDGSALTAGGWTIGATTITGTNVVLDSAGLIRSGATSYAAGTGWIFDYNGGTPRGRIGTTAGNRLSWDGTDLTLVSAGVNINSGGISLGQPGESGWTESFSYKWATPDVNDELGVGAYEISTTGLGIEIRAYDNSEGTTAFLQVQAASTATIVASGVVQVINLAGTGTRNVQADANGVLSAASDVRLKTNIEPYAAGLAAVLQLKPVLYNWTKESGFEPTSRNVGFIAQDVGAVLPHAAGPNADGYWGFNDRAIIAALVNAVQELASR